MTETINEEKLAGAGIWSETRSVLEYGPISAKLVSDQPAYVFVGCLVNSFLAGKKNQKILDLGCHNGSSTAILAHNNPQAHILGVDNNPFVIEEAMARNTSDKVTFQAVETDQWLEGNTFDVAVLTFLHPTVKTRKDLDSIIAKVSNSLKPGGKIIMLGLNPDGFGGDYISYNHHLIGDYVDGAPFFNSLELNGHAVEFEDVCWTEETLREILGNNSFQAEIYPLTRAGLPGLMHVLLSASIREAELNSETHIVWKDEFKGKGLFQVIIGTKVVE